MGGNSDQARVQTLRYAAFHADVVREMERPLLDDGVPLMRMAAAATAHEAAGMLRGIGVALDDARVVVFVGAGNNGGDGLFAAAQLVEHDVDVTVVAVGRHLHDEGFAAFAHRGGRVLVLDPEADIPGCVSGFSAGEAGERLRVAVEIAGRSDLVIDAMTGIGVSGSLHGIAATLVSACAKAWGRVAGDADAVPREVDGDTGRRSRPLVLAVDTPSGVGVDDGTLPGPYLRADATVTFGALKPCAMLPPAAYACGDITLVDFGFDVDDADPAVEMMDAGLAASVLCVPSVRDMKYSRGVVGLVTGSSRYPGAAVLGSCAAARTGAGMVRYLGPKRAQDLVLSALPEAVIGKGHVQAWVVGSGVPAADDTAEGDDMQRETIARLLAHYALDAGDAADGSDAGTPGGTSPYDMPPIVVDAGALDMLPAKVVPQVVITPHAGELARLLTRLDDGGHRVDVDRVLADPAGCARRAHELTGATVLLKGAISVVAGVDSYSEDAGTRVVACGRAPAWLSTAGAGDVLAGMIGAIIAQQCVAGDDTQDMVDTVASAAYVHGLAAAIASQSSLRGWSAPRIYGVGARENQRQVGMPIIAGDVIHAIGQAVSRLLD